MAFGDFVSNSYHRSWTELAYVDKLSILSTGLQSVHQPSLLLDLPARSSLWVVLLAEQQRAVRMLGYQVVPVCRRRSCLEGKKLPTAADAQLRTGRWRAYVVDGYC